MSRATPNIQPALNRPTETKVKLSLTLPEDLHDQFAGRADKNGRTVEKELLEHLRRTKDFTATQPLYFNDDQRARLQKAMGQLVTNADEVLDKISSLISLKVGEISVPLYDRLQTRLRTRVFRGHTLESVVQRETVQALERFTGLR